MPHTVVEYFDEDDTGNQCGYCKGLTSSKSHGMWAHVLACQDYQDLLDRGWRRSGKYCYKPIMDQTCCPQYTIRLDVTMSKLRKSQKKVIKNFNKYVANGVKPNSQNQKNNLSEENSVEDVHDIRVEFSDPPSIKLKEDIILKEIKGPDPEKPKSRKAKEIRMEKKLNKIKDGGQTLQDQCAKSANMKGKNKNREKTLEERIEDIPEKSKIRVQVKLVRCCPESREFKATFKEEYEIYKKYQVAIHKDDPDEVTEKQFRRFLCEGPLIPVECNDENNNEVPSCGFGAFHQLHLFDNQLVAVGVLDILPHCVSSKYFFYDPDFYFLSLGTYSALREIYFIRSLQRECPQLKYYYMGFYIHSCTKMKYKGQFSPSYLLCPESFQWVPIENCVEKLDVKKYSRLEDDHSVVAESYDMNTSLMLYETQFMPFEVFFALLRDPREKRENKKVVAEYTGLTGKASQTMLLYRS